MQGYTPDPPPSRANTTQDLTTTANIAPRQHQQVRTTPLWYTTTTAVVHETSATTAATDPSDCHVHCTLRTAHIPRIHLVAHVSCCSSLTPHRRCSLKNQAARPASTPPSPRHCTTMPHTWPMSAECHLTQMSHVTTPDKHLTQSTIVCPAPTTKIAPPPQDTC